LADNNYKMLYTFSLWSHHQITLKSTSTIMNLFKRSIVSLKSSSSSVSSTSAKSSKSSSNDSSKKAETKPYFPTYPKLSMQIQRI
jgi:hypothetical protein